MQPAAREPAPSRSASRALARPAPALAFAALALVLFAAAMVHSLSYDEEQYVAGAYFARTLSLYGDFISFQPPPYTWLVAAVFDVVDGWYLLTARVVTWLLACGSCLLLYGLLRSQGTGRLAAVVLLLAFVASPFMQGPLAETRNDIMPLFCLLAGLRCLIGPDGELTERALRLFAGGFFLALAAAIKYSFAFAAPIGFAVLAWQAWRGKRLAHAGGPRLAAFVAGSAIGLLPLAHALVVHQERFVFMTLQFFLEPTSYDYYRERGQGEMMTMAYKLELFARQMGRRGNAAMVFLFAFSAAVVLGCLPRHRWLPALRRAAALLLAGMLLGSLVLGLYVGPHAMYYAPVAVFGALLAGRAYAAARPFVPPWLGAAVLLVVLLPSVPAFERYGRLLVSSTDLGNWAGVLAHRNALAIERALAAQGVSGPVATIFPIVAIDANPVLPHFAGGPFFYRVADAYPAERVQALVGVGPATLDRLFAASPPAAIVAGFGPFRLFGAMDEALIDYARRSGYVRVSDDGMAWPYKGGQLWIRPR